ncbi:MAG: hypothetical protein ACHP84_20625 [Caulobacterales bacterium]
MRAHFCDVHGVCLDRSYGQELDIGDIVSVESDAPPTWRVVALADGRAWLQDVASGGDRILPLNHTRSKAALRLTS